MQRIHLAKESPEFSRVAFGTWRLLNGPAPVTPEQCLALLRACLDSGITTVDTAEIYGGYRVEELLGAALALDPGVKSRMEFITKAGIYVPCDFHPDRKVAFYNATADRLVKSAEKSLRWLGLDTLDLFLVHRPDWLTPAEETAAGLQRLLDSGKVRSVGVSNYTPGQYRALSRHMAKPLVTNQVECSLFHMDQAFDGTFDLCQEMGVRPMAWSPTGAGRLFGDTPEARRIKAVAADLAPAGLDQVGVAWILAQPARPMVVIGTTQEDRIRSYAAADDLVLGREDWYRLTEAARGAGIP